MILSNHKTIARRAVMVALLAIASATAHAQAAATQVSSLIDSLGTNTQAGPSDDWTAQRQAETNVARQIRELIAANPKAQDLIAGDWRGQTPLIQAALRGYAQIVDALLTADSVRGAINAKDKEGLTAWMAAQFARPLTLAACHPQVLIREAVGLWGPNLRRITYFSQQSPQPFERIRVALAAAGAQPDLEAAKRYWLEHCPGHAPELNEKIASSEDLMNTLLSDSNPRLQSFFKNLQDMPTPRPPKFLPEQPRFKEPVRLGSGVDKSATERNEMRCPLMPKPNTESIEELNWGGQVLFKVVVEVQDGVPVAAATTVLSGKPLVPPEVAMFFRAAMYRTLGTYRCVGDHLFEQEFLFDYR